MGQVPFALISARGTTSSNGLARASSSSSRVHLTITTDPHLAIKSPANKEGSCGALASCLELGLHPHGMLAEVWQPSTRGVALSLSRYVLTGLPGGLEFSSRMAKSQPLCPDDRQADYPSAKHFSLNFPFPNWRTGVMAAVSFKCGDCGAS
ncbi:hypothetical protein NL676_025940 [Syzygium grande]|nr:hypothetical protein NL676_025940 [Syzygium grande]